MIWDGPWRHQSSNCDPSQFVGSRRVVQYDGILKNPSHVTEVDSVFFEILPTLFSIPLKINAETGSILLAEPSFLSVYAIVYTLLLAVSGS